MFFIASAEISSLNSTPMSRMLRGCAEQISAVSRTRLASAVFITFDISDKTKKDHSLGCTVDAT